MEGIGKADVPIINMSRDIMMGCIIEGANYFKPLTIADLELVVYSDYKEYFENMNLGININIDSTIPKDKYYIRHMDVEKSVTKEDVKGVW